MNIDQVNNIYVPTDVVMCDCHTYGSNSSNLVTSITVSGLIMALCYTTLHYSTNTCGTINLKPGINCVS